MDDKIRRGRIQLPPCKPHQIWCMVDSGSAPHVADHKRHFPGATLKPSKSKNTAEFATATGDPFAADGEFRVAFKTQEGQQRHVTFQNAPVTVPIVSSGKMCDEDNEITYTKTGGYIKDCITGGVTKIQRGYGVYWIKPTCADGIRKPNGKDAPFQRPGGSKP